MDPTLQEFVARGGMVLMLHVAQQHMSPNKTIVPRIMRGLAKLSQSYLDGPGFAAAMAESVILMDVIDVFADDEQTLTWALSVAIQMLARAHQDDMAIELSSSDRFASAIVRLLQSKKSDEAPLLNAIVGATVNLSSIESGRVLLAKHTETVPLILDCLQGLTPDVPSSPRRKQQEEAVLAPKIRKRLLQGIGNFLHHPGLRACMLEADISTTLIAVMEGHAQDSDVLQLCMWVYLMLLHGSQASIEAFANSQGPALLVDALQGYPGDAMMTKLACQAFALMASRGPLYKTFLISSLDVVPTLLRQLCLFATTESAEHLAGLLVWLSSTSDLLPYFMALADDVESDRHVETMNAIFQLLSSPINPTALPYLFRMVSNCCASSQFCSEFASMKGIYNLLKDILISQALREQPKAHIHLVAVLHSLVVLVPEAGETLVQNHGIVVALCKLVRNHMDNLDHLFAYIRLMGALLDSGDTHVDFLDGGGLGAVKSILGAYVTDYNIVEQGIDILVKYVASSPPALADLDTVRLLMQLWAAHPDASPIVSSIAQILSNLPADAEVIEEMVSAGAPQLFAAALNHHSDNEVLVWQVMQLVNTISDMSHAKQALVLHGIASCLVKVLDMYSRNVQICMTTLMIVGKVGLVAANYDALLDAGILSRVTKLCDGPMLPMRQSHRAATGYALASLSFAGAQARRPIAATQYGVDLMREASGEEGVFPESLASPTASPRASSAPAGASTQRLLSESQMQWCADALPLYDNVDDDHDQALRKSPTRSRFATHSAQRKPTQQQVLADPIVALSMQVSKLEGMLLASRGSRDKARHEDDTDSYSTCSSSSCSGCSECGPDSSLNQYSLPHPYQYPGTGMAWWGNPQQVQYAAMYGTSGMPMTSYNTYSYPAPYMQHPPHPKPDWHQSPPVAASSVSPSRRYASQTFGVETGRLPNVSGSPIGRAVSQPVPVSSHSPNLPSLPDISQPFGPHMAEQVAILLCSDSSDCVILAQLLLELDSLLAIL